MRHQNRPFILPLVNLSAPKLSVSEFAGRGLTFVTTFLVKPASLPLLAVSAMFVLLKIGRLAGFSRQYNGFHM